ncbi:DUF3993 domain-containing protein [Cytobacillus depressus]|uniref:DUF3993 domain-containing protein n=1 Tax=Cytobacillus depressus TaxID=1602942 RepID=A0A6L3V9W9_9BACI|nr:DUF3993 domain-containing protein [Cytobacillus depressus]KAB2337333.1 DUF3993 domain-containing protein [Cytobacillus depressus]
MDKLLKLILPVVIALAAIQPTLTKADANISNEELFAFVQAAFQAQVSLSEKSRSLDEVNEMLIPFFTKETINVFSEENLFSEDGLFITYGTDFPQYYIPFFTYTDETKIVRQGDEIFLYEFFPESNDGPVSYESHYEGIKLVKSGEKWKVADFLFDVPEELLIQEEKEVTGSLLSSKEYQNKIKQSSLWISLCMNPVEFFFKYGSYVPQKKLPVNKVLFGNF